MWCSSLDCDRPKRSSVYCIAGDTPLTIFMVTMSYAEMSCSKQEATLTSVAFKIFTMVLI